MSSEMIVLFVVGPLIILCGNLILAPRFQKHIPMKVHIRSAIIGVVLYLLGAVLVYYFFLQGKI